MNILGIDTATRIASVGLVRDGETVAERANLSASNHTETLLPLILQLLEDAHCSLHEVQGMGVSIGPGSFTGLRVALGTVKGFAYALGQQVVGVSTLEALARTVGDWEGDICTVLDARKAEVYTAFFRRDAQGAIRRKSVDHVVAPHDFFSALDESCLFLGDGVERYEALLKEQCGPLAKLLPFSQYHPQGGTIACMAWEQFCRGESSEIGILTPTYVRKPEAEFRRMSGVSLLPSPQILS